ncbi:hypothetical protein BpHYR1_037456 [Brachionus plicatilis]|uniref:Uncharacterized protein n=1 Tax=Brachionus plicatilis TaxID=10195 RepID=A0A3M7SFC9_BRAPC|nr:hypothetical protein BpHYR1_037456 [Brachionus plicatilis]
MHYYLSRKLDTKKILKYIQLIENLFKHNFLNKNKSKKLIFFIFRILDLSEIDPKLIEKFNK